MPTYLEKYGHTVITVAAIIAAFVGLVTINGNRFDAQDRRLDAQDRLISQLFEGVNQRLDGQDRRLDAQDRLISQLFEGVNQRLDGQDTLINRHFEAVDRHFEAVNQRLDGHDKRLDRLTDEVSELRRLTVGISERVSRSEGEIDVIREQLRIADTPSP